MTTTLPSTPQTLTAVAEAAAALVDWGLPVPAGIYGFGQLSKDKVLADLDLSQVVTVGEVYAEVNLEAIAAAGTELVVDMIEYDPSNASFDTPYGLGSTKLENKIETLAPIAAISNEGFDDAIARMGALAQSLGADPNSEAIVQAKADFESAKADLQAAASQYQDIRVMAVTPTTDVLYVASPLGLQETIYFGELGVNMVGPTVAETDDGRYAYLSWEKADLYPADVILVDDRVFVDPSSADTNPAWTHLPAVEADQLGTHVAENVLSYQFGKTRLEAVTQALNGAKVVA